MVFEKVPGKGGGAFVFFFGVGLFGGGHFSLFSVAPFYFLLTADGYCIFLYGREL